jgi:type VI secretion system secreted protein Hcp
MAITFFLRIEGIDGEAATAEPPYHNTIEVKSWNWGATGVTLTRPGPGTASAGKPAVQGLTCTKWVDRATPKIYESLLQGKHIPQSVLSCVRSVGPARTAKYDRFLVLTMSDCVISSALTGSDSGEERLTESVTLLFSKIQLDYYYRDPSGRESTFTFKWDAAAGAKF